MGLQMVAGLALLVGLPFLAAQQAAPPKPQTPSQEFQALVKRHREAQKHYSQAYQSAKTDAERKRISETLGVQANSSTAAVGFLNLVRRYPTDPVALDAFRWLVGHEPDNPPTQEAAKIVAENWAASDKVESVWRSLKYYPCSAGAGILRSVLEKNTHRAVQGHARFSLALYLKHEYDRSSSGPVTTDPSAQSRKATRRGHSRLRRSTGKPRADVEESGQRAIVRAPPPQHRPCGPRHRR